MRVVPIAAALWAAHALAQSPAPAAPTPAPSTAPAASAPAPSTSSPTMTSPSTAAPATESAASSSSSSSSASTAPAAVTPSAPAEQITNWGIMLEGGIPDGVGASAIFRPMTWLRLSAGGAYNFVAFGFRGGVSVVPFYFPFSPSLNLDVGHFLGGDATPILQTAFQGSGITVPPDSPVLKQVAYDYADATLGLEFGLPKTFTIFLRVGVSYIRTVLNGFEGLVQQAAAGDGNPPDTSITAQPPTITLTAPSLKLGLIVYF